MSLKKHRDSGKISLIFTRETIGMTVLLFSAIVLLMLFTREKVFAGLGTEICSFMYGAFGYGCIPLTAYLAYLGVKLTFGKKINIKLRYFLTFTAAILLLFLLFHCVTTRNYDLSGFRIYVNECYLSARSGWGGYTFGGSVCGILIYPVAKLTTFIGAYVIYSLLFLLCAYFIAFLIKRNMPPKEVAADNQKIAEEENSENINYNNSEPVANENPAYQQPVAESANFVNQNNQGFNYGNQSQNYSGYSQPSNQGQEYAYRQPYQQPMPLEERPAYNYGGNSANEQIVPNESNEKYSRQNLGRKIIFEKGEFDAESYKRNMIYSGESYFNHPVDGVQSYLSNFKGSSETSAPSQDSSLNSPPQSGFSKESEPQSYRDSYTNSYQNEVANQPVAEAPSSYVYGEKPVENLEESFEDYGNGSAHFEKEVGGQEHNESFSEQEPAAYFEKPREKSPESDQPESNRDFSRGDIFGRSRTSEHIESSIEEPRERTENLRRAPNGDDDNNLFGGENRRGIRNDSERVNSRSENSKINLFDDDNNESEEQSDDMFGLSSRGASRSDREDFSEKENGSGRLGDRFDGGESRVSRNERDSGLSGRCNKPAESIKSLPNEEPPKQEKPKHVWKQYVRPSLDLLDDYPENNNVNTGEIEDNKRIIVETLEKFKIESQVSNVIVGPAITRYDVIIPDRTNIKRSLSYRDEIALALMKDNVSVYLNYSKGAISIEIPNNKRSTVGLKTMLASPQFINCKPNSLTFGLGKNVEGAVVCPDITKMPHLLVAGTTGSGKSICLNTLLVSLLYKYGPEELRLILVDPKQAEFITFNKLPHLMINEILYEVDKVIKALNWAIKEMERRYSLFKEMTENGVATRNLDEYNAHLPAGEEKLPKILIVLDEFGDLMMQAKKDIEFKIIRLAQKARACGIHLILATQRPSVDCITGLIKSNLPSRIGFKVNSFDDSRTIFDVGGAEKLLGKGDMYFRSAENPELTRIQGCFIDSHEVQKVANFVREHNETYFDQDVSDFINKVEEPEVSASSGGDDNEEMGDGKMDETYLKALKYCIMSNQASVSMIQRRFPVGYIKACKIIDWMDKMNYVTKSEGSKPRKVLMTMDEFTNTYGEVDD